MKTVLVTPPNTEPLTLEEVKAHLRVEVPNDDTLIVIYIAAARQWCESFTRRAFMPQTWDVYLDGFPEDEIEIPLSPVASVTYVKYIDGNGVTQTLADGTDYTTSISTGPSAGRTTIEPYFDTSFPTPRDQPDSVWYRYVAGYADAASVPGPIRAAILLLVGHLYANREAVVAGTIASEVPFTIKNLLYPFRLYEFK